MRDRFIEIDILRVIAISFIIMVRHIDDYASEMFQSQLVRDLTHVSLGILVLISGYLLVKTTTIFRSIADIKSYLYKKILRIYPLYVLVLFLFYLLSIISSNQLYSGLLFYNLFNGEHILTLWYISMLMFFYIIFIALNYKSNTLRLFLISAAIFFLLIVEKLTLNRLDGNLILYFPSFICGIFIAKYSHYLKLTINKSIFMIGLFLIVLFLKHLAPSKLGIIKVNMMIVSFALPSMYFFSKIKIHAVIRKFIINLSYASFCMYLAHRIIFEIALFIYKPTSDIATLLYLYLVAIPIICTLAFYTQKFYDKLFRYKIVV